jgi:hypothetical protein
MRLAVRASVCARGAPIPHRRRRGQNRNGGEVAARVARDVASCEATSLVRATPTLFIDGVLHSGGYETATLLEALARRV